MDSVFLANIIKDCGIKMDRDLSSYVVVLENWIDEESCKQTIREMQNANWQQHTFYNAMDGSYNTRSGSKELDVAYGRGLSTQPYIMQRIWDAYKEYVTHLNFTWFDSWQGYSEVRFNMYKETRLMAEHCDHIHTLFDGERKGIPTLTFLGMLNDDYEGGELIMWGDEKIPMAKGSAVVFPSCFLYPHRVEPVTSGTRYSCVSWAW
jgi:predicted 2-oxoglutarate/Fe(II)-dependent dioxygenase YbiX